MAKKASSTATGKGRITQVTGAVVDVHSMASCRRS